MGGVITRAGSMVMLRLVDVAVLPSESVTFTVNVEVPAVVGVPLAMVPLAPRVKGVGREPEASVNV